MNHWNIPNVNQSKYLSIVIGETNCNPDLKRQMCKLYANVTNYHLSSQSLYCKFCVCTFVQVAYDASSN